jgi:cation diffusion facilitator family transporter
MTDRSNPQRKSSSSAASEKIRAARASVWSAVFLTVMKGVVGFLTGSLGILAEALHSLLDLGAAAMTLFSVRYSERPADSTHHYGHGKIENLSALAESLLLLVTCGWILWEAGKRLMGQVHPEIEAVFAGIVVMGISIVVDWYRSRKLMHAARKHRSQALEADALHFSSDILSSSVVILGLLCVKFGFPQADAMAALFVAVWVGVITVRLAMRSIHDLIDTAPRKAREAVQTAVEKLDGIEKVAGVRVRQAGPKTFADLTLHLDRRLSLEEAHRRADEAERAVQQVLPEADIVVHTEPISTPVSASEAGGPIREAFDAVAAQMKVRFHHISLFEGTDGMTALVDLEFPGSLSLQEARERADILEREVQKRVPSLQEVVAHIDIDYSDRDRVVGKTGDFRKAPSVDEVEKTVLGVPGVDGCHGIRFNEYVGDGEEVPSDKRGGFVVSIHIVVEPGTSVAESHEVGLRVEQALCDRFQQIRKVHIHQEARKNA